MDIKSLKRSRASFKSKLTIFKTYLDTLLPCKELNNLQIRELTIRASKIQEMYNEYDSTQTEIENLSEIPGDEYLERESFETSYFSTVAAAQEALDKHTAASAARDNQSVTGSSAFSALQIRSKWHTNRGQLQLGQMVLIKDDRLPPNRWLLGRITAVYPGTDGINRVADVLSTSGTLRRAYNRLCPLPMTLDQDTPAPRGPAC
ncbi:uncharacterized protein LOC125489760 [Plutella xylostella]|uniref:uncharacterized protein LOC105393699 n=1 Tax=Plutella xylostella TaxID=51655 RepID=UPI0005D0A531|nr:uncharacterized protein LOC105393699 [Plutella xylostella]XP_037972312.2 uncharacterized protein LOC119693311 [Plutella xylostella]XP_048481739.1 uncharacterized protein LOC125489589 [Plutella xylostella]XP_048482657.1 uncharacterized protein LOC125489760 [Plutella xylostella]